MVSTSSSPNSLLPLFENARLQDLGLEGLVRDLRQLCHGVDVSLRVVPASMVSGAFVWMPVMV